MAVKRTWTEARAKVDQEGVCRACGASDRLEAAHTAGQKHDPPDGRVRAVDIIPLCGQLSRNRCHPLYDAHELNILPLLSYAEQAAVVEHLGIDRALHRLTSGQNWIVGETDVLEDLGLQ